MRTSGRTLTTIVDFRPEDVTSYRRPAGDSKLSYKGLMDLMAKNTSRFDS